MDVLLYLIPIALTLGILWLFGFMWALKGNQFDDPEGAANRILFEVDSQEVAQSEDKKIE